MRDAICVCICAYVYVCTYVCSISYYDIAMFSLVCIHRYHTAVSVSFVLKNKDTVTATVTMTVMLCACISAYVHVWCTVFNTRIVRNYVVSLTDGRGQRHWDFILATSNSFHIAYREASRCEQCCQALLSCNVISKMYSFPKCNAVTITDTVQ